MPTRELRLGEFVVEPAADRVLGPDGSRRDLEPKTMAVLLALIERAGEVVSSDDLIRGVWRGRPLGDNPVHKAISKLRHAFDDTAAEPRYVETIPRKGYRLLVQSRPLRRPDVAAGTADHALTRADGLPLEARQLYSLACAELRERRIGFALRLRRAAEQLIAVAPEYAPGHALQSIGCSFRAVYARHPCYMRPGFAPIDGAEALACAHRSARRALELDPASAEALAAAGFLAYVEAWDCTSRRRAQSMLEIARARLERAVQSGPSLPEAHYWLGMVCQQQGDTDRATREAEAALELDPLNPVVTVNANRFLMARGENARVRERLLALTQRPGVPPIVYAQLLDNAFAAGDVAEARHWTSTLQRAVQNGSVRRSVTSALARLDPARTPAGFAALQSAATAGVNAAHWEP